MECKTTNHNTTPVKKKSVRMTYAALANVYRWLIIVTSLMEMIFGSYGFVTTEKLVGGSASLLFAMTGILLFYSMMTKNLILLSLIQVFTCSYFMILLIVIITSLYLGLDDHLLVGIYFAGFFFFLLQAILMNEYAVIKFQRLDYQIIGDDTTDTYLSDDQRLMTSSHATFASRAAMQSYRASQV